MANFEPRFELSDTEGRTIRESDFKGRYVLITFGYTFCPDVCPTTLQTVALVLDQLGTDGESVIPVFVTIDPERDKPDHLRSYVQAFHKRLRAFTGTEAQIADTARNFRVIYRKSAVQSSETYLIDHTASLYLIGRMGEPLGKFSHNLAPDELARRVRQRMMGAQR